jgi:hypothetical protein
VVRRLLVVAWIAAATVLVAVSSSGAAACTITFDGNGTGATAWAVAANWDTNVLPAAGDHACIPAGQSVVFSSGTAAVQSLTAAGSLTISGGTLTLTSTSDASSLASFTMTDGILAGNARVNLTGTFTWSGGDMSGLGTTVIAAGATATHDDYAYLVDGRRLEVAGTLAFVADRPLWRSGIAGLVHVKPGGLLRKSAGAGESQIDVFVENDGVVDATSGWLRLSYGGGAEAATGAFGTAGQAGEVRLTGGSFPLGTGAHFRGGTHVAGATVEVLDGQTAVASGAANVLSDGKVSGTGTFEIGGAYAWSGGDMEGLGTTVIKAGATVTHDDYAYLIGGRRLEVAGTLQFVADLPLWRSGVTGLVHVQPGGRVRKSAGTGESQIDVFLENDGIVDATAGSLRLSFGGGAEAATGAFGTAGQAGEVRLTGGSFPVATGAHFRGGTDIDGATVEVLDNQKAIASGTANALSDGKVSGTGTFEIGGAYAWSGGDMEGLGTTVIKAGATVTHDDYAYLIDGRRLDVAGTLSLVADKPIWKSGVIGLVHVLPGGLVRKSASAGEALVDVFVENDGVIDATHGWIRLSGGGGAETATGAFGTAGQGGQVRLSGGTFPLATGAHLRGGVQLAGATVEVPTGATLVTSGTGNGMTGGTVTGPGATHLGGSFKWSGGKMSGAGTTKILSGATVTHDGGTHLENGRKLEVAGTLELVSVNAIDRSGPAEPLLHVLPGGVLRKKTSAGESRIDAALRNQGTVESTGGRLGLYRGDAVASTGVFKGASATDVVSFRDGTHRLGTGTDLESWVEVGGATVEIPDGVTLPVDDNLVLEWGAIGGAGRLTVPGVLRWRGGAQRGAGTTEVPAGGQVLVEGCGVDLLDGRTLDNKGTVRVSGTLEGSSATRPVILNAGRIELDDATGTCSGDPGVSGNALILNTGTIDKLGGTGAGYVDATLDNDGVATATKGELRLSSTTAVTHNGSFTSAAGATVTFYGGTFVLGPAASGTGTLKLAAVLEPGGPFTVAAGSLLRIDGGTLRGAGDVTVAGTLEFLDGQLEGAGALIVQSGATALVGGPNNWASVSDDRQVVNRGTMTLTGGSMALSQGASLLNAGSFAITGNASVHGDGFGFGADSMFHNAGALVKSGTGAGEISTALDNDGTVEVTGGSLYLRSPLNYSTAGDALTGGRYVVRAPGLLRLPGPVKALGAPLLLDGAGSSVTWHESSSSPIAHDALGLLDRVTSAGELQLAGGRDMTLTGALANGGAVRLGAGSELTAGGGYRQTGGLTRLGGDGARVAGAAGQTVNVQGGRLAGRGAAAQVLDLDDGGTVHVRAANGAVDQIAVPGEARLDGTLQIDTDPAFNPSPGTELTVLTYGSRTGTFDAVTGLSPRPGLTYTLEYRAGAVVLEVAGTGAQAPGAAEAGAPPGETHVAALEPLRIDDRTLLARGSWTRVRRAGRTLSVAAATGATLRARDVQGSSLALVAETCRRCGSVSVYWRGRLLARVSLRASRRGLRKLDLGALRGGRGTVELRASGRVAIDALVVRR